MEPRVFKCVAITGSTGYIGGRFARKIESLGARVVRVGRVSSQEEIVQMFEVDRPDIVFHFASLFIADHSPDQVTPLVESNILFGARLLEAMKISGVANLVYAGSSWQRFGDSGEWPVNLYAATKNAFTELVRYYVDAHSFKALQLLIYDSYGPDDPRGKLLTTLFGGKGQHGNAGTKLSPGLQRVCFVHVDDVVRGFEIAGKRIQSGMISKIEEFVLRPKSAVTLRESIQEIENLTGVRPVIEWGARPYRKREVMEPWDGGVVLPEWEPKKSFQEGAKDLLGGY